jgi:hypothetical protein
MLSALGIFVLVTAALLAAARHVAEDERTRVDRARTAGEPGLEDPGLSAAG